MEETSSTLKIPSMRNRRQFYYHKQSPNTMLKFWWQQLSVCGKNHESLCTLGTQMLGALHKQKNLFIVTSPPPPIKLAFDVEDFLHESGLVVDECILTTLQEIEKNKQLKGVPGLVAAGAGGEPLRPPKSKSDMFWTCITSFFHPQSSENFVDEIYGRLVRTHKWRKKEQTLCSGGEWNVSCTDGQTIINALAHPHNSQL